MVLDKMKTTEELRDWFAPEKAPRTSLIYKLDILFRRCTLGENLIKWHVPKPLAYWLADEWPEQWLPKDWGEL